MYKQLAGGPIKRKRPEPNTSELRIEAAVEAGTESALVEAANHFGGNFQYQSKGRCLELRLILAIKNFLESVRSLSNEAWTKNEEQTKEVERLKQLCGELYRFSRGTAPSQKRRALAAFGEGFLCYMVGDNHMASTCLRRVRSEKSTAYTLPVPAREFIGKLADKSQDILKQMAAQSTEAVGHVVGWPEF